MIDTVVLIIQEGFYKVLDPNKFTPSTEVLDRPVGFGAKAFAKCLQNPTKEDYQKGIYKPRLTITKRATKIGIIKTLKVEFSCSKLLFLNNLNELTDKDFSLLIDTLHKRLLEMCVEVSKTSLQLATVSTVHYSKNIILPSFVTSTMIIKELAKVNITKRLSLDKTFFKNKGHALTFYSKSYAIVIYDKIKDIQKTTVVKVDGDPTSFQQGLFEVKKPSSEILRIEIRLNHPYKIESLFKAIGKPAGRSFINVFREEKARLVIRHYWSLITNSINKFIFTSDESLHKTAEEIYQANPNISAIKLLSIIGYFQIVKQDSGRALREFIEKHYTSRTWFRINKAIRETLKTKKSLKYLTFVTEINKAIEEFEPLKLLDFEAEMINNDKYN